MLKPYTNRDNSRAHLALLSLVQQEADRHGVIPFARFMELALYHPEWGYYECPKQVIGQRGDYFTNVSIGPLFGQLLTAQFLEWMRFSVIPKPILLESGAHDGQLAEDVITSLQQQDGRLAASMEYWILENSGNRKSVQQHRLQNAPMTVRWFDSWTSLNHFCDNQNGPFTGILFSNELLDAFPAHRVSWNASRRDWEELGVANVNGALTWRHMPLSEDLVESMHAFEPAFRSNREDDGLLWPWLSAELLDALPDRFTIEICPAALNWWKDASKFLASGWLTTIDYGGTAAELITPERCQGTMRAYSNHQVTNDLLDAPGTQDLTAHVNFTQLLRIGEHQGLRTQDLITQERFFSRLLSRLEQSGNPMTPDSPEQIRQLKTILHPGHMGRAFKVLVQHR